MLSPRSVLLLSLASVVGILVWASSVPDEIALDQSCAPIGSAAIAAAVHGRTFWETQSVALSAERDWLLSVPAKLDLAQESERKDRSHLDDRLNRLSRGDPEAEEKAQAAAQSRRAVRLEWVLRCGQKAAEKSR